MRTTIVIRHTPPSPSLLAGVLVDARGERLLRSTSENPSDSPIELTAPVAFKHRGVEMRLALPGEQYRTTAHGVTPR
jgi:hypothetical protein